MRPRDALVLFLAPWCASLAAAAGPDRWAADRAEERERMEEMAEAEIRGDLGPEERRELDRYWATHLRRCPMDAVASALTSAAELHLQRGKPQAALAALQKILAARPPDEVRNLTHFNLAEVWRRQLKDTARAAEHYRQVRGPRRHRARYTLLRMLVEAGRTQEAAELLENLVRQAAEKGEKLALLHQLATLYKRHKMPEQALAVYERIADEFTPADVETMRQAAAQEVKDGIRGIMKCRERGQWEEAERLERRLHLRARELLLAQRWDELEAFRRAAEKGFQALERHGEEMERREREDQREHEPEQGGPPGADF